MTARDSTIEGALWDVCALLAALSARISEMEIHEADTMAVGTDAAAELRCLCRITHDIVERQAQTLAKGGMLGQRGSDHGGAA